MQGVHVGIFDKNSSSTKFIGSGTTDKEGYTSFDILMGIEIVKVITEKVTIENCQTKEIVVNNVDYIVYISFDRESHGLLVILPIVEIKTPWPNALCQVVERDYLEIIKENLPEGNITALYPVVCE